PPGECGVLAPFSADRFHPTKCVRAQAGHVVEPIARPIDTDVSDDEDLAVRMLRLATSDDIRPTVADHEHGDRFVEPALAAVESMVREIWPNPGLADVIAAWMDRFQPDVVSLKASSFWFSYPSVPLRLRRSSLGRTGRGIARVGFGAAQVPWVAHSAAYRVVRDTVRRV